MGGMGRVYIVGKYVGVILHSISDVVSICPEYESIDIFRAIVSPALAGYFLYHVNSRPSGSKADRSSLSPSTVFT